jgi:acyl-CoA thioester hydrolase
MAHQFEHTITVLPEHLDNQNHVNNVIYLQFMQDIAIEHWGSVVPAAMETEIVWVVKRHEVDYHAPALLGDELLVKTYTGALSTVSWDRHCEIIRLRDGKKIISSKSAWVCLDRKTGRPRRIDDAIKAVFD